MAAKSQTPHNPRVVHVIHPRAVPRVASRYRQPQFAGNNDLGQLIQGFFGGALPQPYSRLISSAAARASAAHRDMGTYDSSPSYDYTSTETSSAGTDAQAASDAESQAIQQMNDTNALNASMAAAEQENDAANAATLQTEINAGF
jgi:hypothetical protein